MPSSGHRATKIQPLASEQQQRLASSRAGDSIASPPLLPSASALDGSLGNGSGHPPEDDTGGRAYRLWSEKQPSSSSSHAEEPKGTNNGYDYYDGSVGRGGKEGKVKNHKHQQQQKAHGQHRRQQHRAKVHGRERQMHYRPQMHPGWADASPAAAAAAAEAGSSEELLKRVHRT
ncbi:hypothetical protein ZHAS_00018862 [Anopheles sinensis]|uniref:Uncharacterized protein n=1 Tax=Anopheles sinensis TaxID=74873 RepID=A0A084WKR5_ANOSI|nr:hypothetical protein ZHAS_00018862 [Anopheles sinensis]